MVSQDEPSAVRQARLLVQTYMQNPKFDSSHDFAHVNRVLALARHLLKCECDNTSRGSYDPLILDISTLFHDIQDHKYTDSDPSDCNEPDILLTHVQQLGLPQDIQQAILAIVPCVSFSFSQRNAQLVSACAEAHPELKLLQDADRLDALGAYGIGRAFTYGGARGRSLQDTLMHFEEKLEKLAQGMWTEEGARMARERTQRLTTFKGWWQEETKLPQG